MQEGSHICTLRLNPLDSTSICGAEIKAWASAPLHSQRGLLILILLGWFRRWQLFGLLVSTSHSHSQHLQLAWQQIHRALDGGEKWSVLLPRPQKSQKHPTSSFNKEKHLVWVGLEIPGIFLRSDIPSHGKGEMRHHSPCTVGSLSAMTGKPKKGIKLTLTHSTAEQICISVCILMDLNTTILLSFPSFFLNVNQKDKV